LSPWKQKEPTHILPDRLSIAILPFDDLSPQKDHEYLCDGFADELISRLSKINRLRIPARTSSFSFKGKGLSIQEIGEKLEVENILEGSIRKAENKLRITVQLINISDGYPTWSERYERDDTDIFSLQDEISIAIVDNLRIMLLEEEQAKFEKRYTQDPVAYNLYLQGRFFWWKRTQEGLKKALEYFEQAIEKDPDYALAHVGLADTYTMIEAYGFASTQEVLQKIKEGVKRALEIDDKLAEAHTTLGNIKMYYDRDWEGAKKEFQIALKINPNYSWTQGQYADCLLWMGQFDLAFEEMKKWREKDPFNKLTFYQIGFANYYVRRYKRAEEALKNTIMMDPNFYTANYFLGKVYLQQSKYNEALEEFQKVIDHTAEGSSGAHSLYCVVLAKMGKDNEAEQKFEELIELSKRKSISSLSLAQFYSVLDEKDKAFECLEKAISENDSGLKALKIEPLFDSLRSDPRFADLLKRRGFR
jgi:TolB-like protein/Tfp pilus assembly protein PilF